MSSRPLDGITVVSLEHAIAAPFCTRQLADLGARVIKVERPAVGDFARRYDERTKGLASHFVWANRSKESLELDLKNPEDLHLLHCILQKADIFVQNLAPNATKRLGLDYEKLHTKYPALIVCDISGFGQGGCYADKKAYDLLIQAESGFLSITGTPDDMAKAGNSIADISAGMYAYSAILSALLLRTKTHKGSHIDVSMLESLTEWMGYPMYYAYEGASPPPRTGASHATIYPYGYFKVADSTIIFGLQNEREWEQFCTIVLQDSTLATDTRFDQNSKRSANRDALNIIIDSTLGKLTLQEATQRLDTAKIAYAKVNTVGDVWQHPQLLARQRFVKIHSSAGQLLACLPPATNSEFAPVMGDVPALGEHNDKIHHEFLA
ncbi:MAG: CaiB/BaiF CoA-transferase family protein [Moraxella sp.]|nr:CaiB/BaiF CoA-transferase family protein [Moraxella sp.]